MNNTGSWTRTLNNLWFFYPGPPLAKPPSRSRSLVEYILHWHIFIILVGISVCGESSFHGQVRTYRSLEINLVRCYQTGVRSVYKNKIIQTLTAVLGCFDEIKGWRISSLYVFLCSYTCVLTEQN